MKTKNADGTETIGLGPSVTGEPTRSKSVVPKPHNLRLRGRSARARSHTPMRAKTPDPSLREASARIEIARPREDSPDYHRRVSRPTDFRLAVHPEEINPPIQTGPLPKTMAKKGT